MDVLAGSDNLQPAAESDRRLAEKVAIITGAGRGIGKAVALAYAPQQRSRGSCRTHERGDCTDLR